MVETVGSNQKNSLDVDLAALASAIKAAKKLNAEAPEVKAAEEDHKKLAAAAEKIVVATTKVEVYEAVRKAMTATVQKDVKALKKVEAPVAKGPVDLGIAGLSKSEAAVKLLESLEKGALKGKLVLKDGDKQHPGSKLWELDGKKGSVPTTAHTKGDGGKNEKAALVELKKVFKSAGYV